MNEEEEHDTHRLPVWLMAAKFVRWIWSWHHAAAAMAFSIRRESQPSRGNPTIQQSFVGLREFPLKFPNFFSLFTARSTQEKNFSVRELLAKVLTARKTQTKWTREERTLIILKFSSFWGNVFHMCSRLVAHISRSKRSYQACFCVRQWMLAPSQAFQV